MLLVEVVGTKKYTTPDNSFDQLKQFVPPENIFNQLKKKSKRCCCWWWLAQKKTTTPDNSFDQVSVARKHIQSIKKKKSKRC